MDRTPRDGATFEDRDPFTGDVVALVAAGGARRRAARVEAAAAAFPAWSQCRLPSGSAIFLKAADVLESPARRDRRLLARETGCTFGFGMFQMHFVPGLFRQAAALAYAPLGQILPSDVPGTLAMGMRKPVGVVGAIAPWNAALILSARSIAAPLALGNTVVLKPSEWSPVVGGLIWGEIFAEAGLPAGVLNIVTHAPGEAGPIGDELVEHPAVRRINFTGSTAVGRRLAEAAGRHLKRVVLELGGYNPLIVLARCRPRVRGQRDRVRRVPPPGADLHVGAPDLRRAADRGRVHRRGSRRRRRGSRPATRRSTTRSSAR